MPNRQKLFETKNTKEKYCRTNKICEIDDSLLNVYTSEG